MKKWKLQLLTSAVWTALAQASHAGVIYLQNFSTSVAQTPLSSVNWTAYSGSSTIPATLASNGSGAVAAMLSGGPGGPTPDGQNVNAKQITSNLTTGFVPLLSQNGVQQFIAYTNEFAINQSAYSQLSFNWSAATAYSGDLQRLAVQVGYNWYASMASISPPVVGTLGTAFPTGAGQFTTPLSTSWETLNFAPGTDLIEGSATALPVGVITGFGIYAQIADNPSATNERTFFDTFEVTGTPVPEPVGGMILFLAAGALMIRRTAKS